VSLVLPLRLCARFIHFLSRLFLKLYFKDLSAYRTFDFNISVIGIKYSVIFLSFMSLAIFIITGSKISPTMLVIFLCFVKKLREKVVEILYILVCGICCADFNKNLGTVTLGNMVAHILLQSISCYLLPVNVNQNLGHLPG